MTSNNKSISSINNILYLICSLCLYIILYILFAKRVQNLVTPHFGVVTLFLGIIIDYFMAKKRIRIYIRLALLILIYVLLNIVITLFSNLVSPLDGYNIIVDKLPYIYRRDTITALFLLIFYFFFDSFRKIKVNKPAYYISSIMLIVTFYLLLRIEGSITKSLFRNYFNLSLFLIVVTFLFILRHIVFHQNNSYRTFNKKDVIFFIPLFVIIVFFLFSIVLPEQINNIAGGGSGLLKQNLFQFDFSNFVELKDEIKLGDDRVMIMELEGVDDSIRKRIHEGWNRQIYLKRYALEEYVGNGRFRKAAKYVDPYSPPAFISNYIWELDNAPVYLARSQIIETLYLINIDPSSLMGSDLLVKVVPMSNWDDSPYKQIYRSYCSVFDSSYNTLFGLGLTQEKFLKTINKSRKKMLLHWGSEEDEGKIKERALLITEGFDDDFLKTLLILEYLRNNYEYSLKPGMSKDGNQLNHFLFTSNKGYCSYFAFSMTLMLRAIGIASRVVVGFAPDMDNRTLNYYDIRELHAHAWVEVFFDDYGWLTFDPTSSNFAEGENFEFFTGNKDERNNLIEEILKNKDKLQEINKQSSGTNKLKDIRRTLKKSIRILGLIAFISFILIFLIIIYIMKNFYLLLFISTPSTNLRKKIVYLYKYIIGKLHDLSYGMNEGETVLEYATRLKKAGIIDIVELTKFFQAALFKQQNEINTDMNYITLVYKQKIKTIKSFALQKRLNAYFNISRLWKKLFILCFILMLPLINPKNIHAKDTGTFKTLDDYIHASEDAIDNGYFDKALKVLSEAEKAYPDSYIPNFSRGTLFYYHDLYENAIIELTKAREKGFINEENYIFLANSYGSIGEDKKAVLVFEEALKNLPPSKNLYDKLSWMYFKVHDIENGIIKAKEGLERYPGSSDLLMTLGTLYSDIHDYPKSKMYYLEAIERSYEDYNSDYFRSIVYYNLSLLENSFLYYEEAYNSARAAITLRDRSSAHLELNYLYIDALELKNAYNEVITATTLEPRTLFPEMSMAEIYILAGKLDKAIILLKELLNNKDFSWMLYFGTNKASYYSELYKLLSIAYEYKVNQINYSDRRDFISNALRGAKKVYYTFITLYYTYKYSNVYIKIGENKIRGGSKLDGLYQLYEGYERVLPNKAYKIINIIEQIEAADNPQMQKIFNIKKTILKSKIAIFSNHKRKKRELLENIELLDPKWEKLLICWTLTEIINSSSGNEKEEYIKQLYKLHPPFLPMHNQSLPIQITFPPGLFNETEQKKLVKFLKGRGIQNTHNSLLHLEIKTGPDNTIELLVSEKEHMLHTYTIKLPARSADYYEELSYKIYRALFVTELY